MNTQTPLVQQRLAEFIKYRHQLKQAMIEQYDLSNESYFVSNAPRTGEMAIEGELWQFFRHGIGFMFENEQSVKVNICEFYRKSAEYDDFELITYFGSFGSKFVRKHLNGDLEEGVRSVQKCGEFFE